VDLLREGRVKIIVSLLLHVYFPRTVNFYLVNFTGKTTTWDTGICIKIYLREMGFRYMNYFILAVDKSGIFDSV
jgi:hypothetical protein